MLVLSFAVSILFVPPAGAGDYSYLLNDERYRRLYELYLLFRRHCFGDDIQIYPIITEQITGADLSSDDRDIPVTTDCRPDQEQPEYQLPNIYVSHDMIEQNISQSDRSAGDDQDIPGAPDDGLDQGEPEAQPPNNSISSDMMEQNIEASEVPQSQSESLDVLSRDKALILRFAASADISEDLITQEDAAAVAEAVKRVYRVVRGDCLWLISRREFGRGSLWRLIFGLNSQLIRDPDLIYPDQEFRLPDGE